MSDDAFEPPKDEPKDDDAVAPVKKTRAPGELPAVGDLFNETIEHFTADIGPYAMAGLSYFGVSMVVIVGSIFVLYFGMFIAAFGGMGIGAAIGGDAGGVIGLLLMFGGMFLIFLLFFAVIAGVLMPMHASTERAMQKHIRGEEPLSIGSPFSTMFVDLPSVVAVSLAASFAAFIGVFFVYVGAFVAMWVLFWASSLVALDRRGPIQALTTSASTVTGDIGGAGTLTLVAVLINMVAGNIPIIGPMFGIAFKVRVHDALFPDA
ncbi:MAG: hypothetical protein EP330_11995 [Deltaproteobacteria bacterium]|nr:MAG: hypothetical protein EP330_11995 [Deltaproteobacteria bacterium]